MNMLPPNSFAHTLPYPAKSGLIICEGITEVKYFAGLVEHPANAGRFVDISVEIYKPGNHSPQGLVKEAKRRIKKAKLAEQQPYDFIWLVFDKDTHSNIAAAFNEADGGALEPAIKIAFSNICFEFFVLLHFERTTRYFMRCEDVISHLERYMPGYSKAANLYALLYRMRSTAFTNCEFVQRQAANDLARGRKMYELAAYTNVHEMVRFLESIN